MAWDDEVAEAMAQVFDKEAGVGTSVTFRRVTQGAFTASTGVRATTNADTVVAALRGPAVTRIADQSGRMVETRHYSILASELSGITPKADDQIVDSGVVYRVTTVGRASEAASWELECSRAGGCRMATMIDEAVILAQVAGLLEAIAGAETNLRVLQLGDEPGDDQATKVTLRMASLRVQRAQRRSTGSEASTADVTIVLELMSPEAQGSQYAAWSAAAHVLALVDGYAVKDGSTGQTLHVGAVDSASDAELGQTGAAAMQRVTITVQATAERFSGTDLQTNFS